MATLFGEIERIANAKGEIGAAITEKGGQVSGTIDTYAQAIRNLIVVAGEPDFEANPNAYYAYRYSNTPAGQWQYENQADYVQDMMQGSSPSSYDYIWFSPKVAEIDQTSMYNFMRWQGSTKMVRGLENFTQVTTMQDGCFEQCSGLVYPIELPPNLTYIGNNFGRQSSIPGPLTIPAGVTYIGYQFLFDDGSFIGPLIINTAYVPENDTYFLSTYDSSSDMYQEGITLEGEGAEAWRTALPNLTSGPYRNLVDPSAEPGAYGVLTYTLDGESATLTVDTLPQYGNLMQNEYGTIKIGKVTLEREQVTSYTFGPACADVPIRDYFLANCTNLTSIGDVPEGVTQIGRGYLENCSSLTSAFSIPASVEYIQDEFMMGCDNFIGPLTVECSAPNEYRSLATENEEAPMYTHGVDMAGSKGFDWSIALSDQEYQPYRKLNAELPTATYGIIISNNGATLLNTPEDVEEMAANGTGYGVRKAYFYEPVSTLTQITTLNGFLSDGYGLTELEGFEYFTHLTAFGNNCFNNMTQLELPALPTTLVSIGDNFGSYSKVGALSIPATVTSIGNYFLAYLNGTEAGPINIPAGVPVPSDTNNALSFGMPTSGIQLTGEGAQAWVVAMPDTYSYPYRHLYVGDPESGQYIQLTDINGKTYTVESPYEATLFLSNVSVGQLSSLTNVEFLEDCQSLAISSLNAFLSGNCSSLQSLTGMENLTSVTTIGNDFLNLGNLNLSRALTTPLVLPPNVTSIGDRFMLYPNQYNQKITFPNGLLSIGEDFLARNGLGVTSYNTELELPSTLQSIGDYFLQGARYNQPLNLPEGLKTIGQYFMMQCSYFAQPLTLPPALIEIGAFFMVECRNFIGPLYPKCVVIAKQPTVTSNYATLSCNTSSAPMFTHGVDITGANGYLWKTYGDVPSRSPYRKLNYVDMANQWGVVTYLTGEGAEANYSLASREELQSLFNANTYITAGDSTIPKANVTSFTWGDPYMGQLSATPAIFGSKYTNLVTLKAADGSDKYPAFAHYDTVRKLLGTRQPIADGCPKLNCTLTTPSLDVEVWAPVQNCPAFNSVITISEGTQILVGQWFYNCTAFNQEVVIPSSVTYLDGYFLSGCTAFNKPVVIPDGVTLIGQNFMNNLAAFEQPLTLPANATNIEGGFMRNCPNFTQFTTNTTSTPSTQYIAQSLDVTSNTAKAYVDGVTISGTGAAAWKAALPDRNSGTYRKLILAS